jgi:orotidine-5'-phosphate decarboxylase
VGLQQETRACHELHRQAECRLAQQRFPAVRRTRPGHRALPAHLRDHPEGIAEFCKAIIDATADLACAFKPQIAYFAALGAEDQLETVCRYLKERIRTSR